eukprot:gene41240-51053_t
MSTVLGRHFPFSRGEELCFDLLSGDYVSITYSCQSQMDVSSTPQIAKALIEQVFSYSEVTLTSFHSIPGEKNNGEYQFISPADDAVHLREFAQSVFVLNETFSLTVGRSVDINYPSAPSGGQLLLSCTLCPDEAIGQTTIATPCDECPRGEMIHEAIYVCHGLLEAGGEETVTTAAATTNDEVTPETPTAGSAAENATSDVPVIPSHLDSDLLFKDLPGDVIVRITDQGKYTGQWDNGLPGNKTVEQVVTEVIVEKEVIKEVLKEVFVDREVIKEVIVEKEVIKEVIVEKLPY